VDTRGERACARGGGGGGALTAATAQLEKSLQRRQGFAEFCATDANGTCSPPSSALNFFFPSVAPDGALLFDGRGNLSAQLPDAMAFAMRVAVGHFGRDLNVTALRTSVGAGARGGCGCGCGCGCVLTPARRC
jgi:hypothetical protein